MVAGSIPARPTIISYLSGFVHYFSAYHSAFCHGSGTDLGGSGGCFFEITVILVLIGIPPSPFIVIVDCFSCGICTYFVWRTLHLVKLILQYVKYTLHDDV